MSKLTIVAVRIVLALMFLGSLFVLFVMVPLLSTDLMDLSASYAYLRIPLVVLPVLGVLTILVCVVCVWQLVTMARAGTVFSPSAFRYVNVIIGMLATAALLTFLLGVFLAPGEAVAPGIVLLIGGLGILITGMALIVVVLRALLAQAVARETHAQILEAELGEVI